MAEIEKCSGREHVNRVGEWLTLPAFFKISYTVHAFQYLCFYLQISVTGTLLLLLLEVPLPPPPYICTNLFLSAVLHLGQGTLSHKGII